MAGVFVNYRSADGRLAAEAIFRDLAANFGPENIFLDRQAILPGVPYPSKIRTWIQETCSVMIAVIGPDWLNTQDGNGKQMLFRPHDWVHDEIADALALGLPVIPVPIFETPLPAATDLPEGIAGLVSREEIRIRHFDRYDDMRELVNCIGVLDPHLAEGGRTVTSTSPPTWVARTSDSLYQGAAQIYSIAYKAEIGAALIKLTQVLGGTTAGAASVISHIPDRKAAAILESMERSKALLILRQMDPRKRRLIMEHMSSDIRYLMAADDYNGSK
jgi:TIR domain-containing protein